MIVVDGLEHTYPGAEHPSVRNISFDIQEGEIFGFLGPSGAGKSTTQKILTRLLPGFRGKVEVMGKPLTEWGADYYATIGVSFELPNHYLKLTARENLAYFKQLYHHPTEDIETVLSWVGLEEDIDQRVSAFSKGMKNRLNFARSLLHRPRLWFLDEPTAGLDPVNARRIAQRVQSQKQQGVTTFLTTHDMHIANLICDRVAFIVDGRIEAIDTPQALRKKFGKREVEVTYRQSERQGGQLESQTFPLDGLGAQEDFLNLLKNHPIETMHSQETTLEDVFVQVTGRRLDG